MGFARDTDHIAHRRRRGEHHRVEQPGLDAFSDLGGRRGGAHRPIGGDLLDLPAEIRQPLHQIRHRHVSGRHEHPRHGVDQVVVGRELQRQVVGGITFRRPQVRGESDATKGLHRAATDRCQLDAGEGARIQAILRESLYDGSYRMLRSEHHPQEPPVDDATNRLLHGLFRARRFDGHRRHHLGGGPETGQVVRQLRDLVLGARHENAPVKQRFGLEPINAGARDVSDAGTEEQKPGPTARFGSEITPRGQAGFLGGATEPGQLQHLGVFPVDGSGFVDHSRNRLVGGTDHHGATLGPAILVGKLDGGVAETHHRGGSDGAISQGRVPGRDPGNQVGADAFAFEESPQNVHVPGLGEEVPLHEPHDGASIGHSLDQLGHLVGLDPDNFTQGFDAD